jgi:hypothetical protein
MTTISYAGYRFRPNNSARGLDLSSLHIERAFVMSRSCWPSAGSTYPTRRFHQNRREGQERQHGTDQIDAKTFHGGRKPHYPVQVIALRSLPA